MSDTGWRSEMEEIRRRRRPQLPAVSARAGSRSGLQQLPNLLSALRLLSVPVLAALAIGRLESAYAWLLIAALLTDVADGWIARHFSLESRLGAQLDSLADSALMLVAVYGVWVFHRDVVTGNAIACALALGLWGLEYLLALVRYGRLSSFHTYLSKLSANVLGLFIGTLFLFGFEPWLFHTAVGATILASAEELALLALLPGWQADVRGLWWVLRNSRRGGGSKLG
jgi:CDP-diacylglycerol--glycerol-3-phosphate 3-phosphatidyltransferase